MQRRSRTKGGFLLSRIITQLSSSSGATTFHFATLGSSTAAPKLCSRFCRSGCDRVSQSPCARGGVMSRTRREFIKTTISAGAVFGATGALGSDAFQSERPIPLPTQRAKALMELFGLKFPIFEAPHGPATCPELAIAISNAGAMGALADLRSPE